MDNLYFLILIVGDVVSYLPNTWGLYGMDHGAKKLCYPLVLDWRAPSLSLFRDAQSWSFAGCQANNYGENVHVVIWTNTC